MVKPSCGLDSAGSSLPHTHPQEKDITPLAKKLQGHLDEWNYEQAIVPGLVPTQVHSHFCSESGRLYLRALSWAASSDCMSRLRRKRGVGEEEEEHICCLIF